MVEVTTPEVINLRYISASSYGEEWYVDVNGKFDGFHNSLLCLTCSNVGT
jgi:hypothetical protein